MKPAIVISSVVFVHAAALSIIGCQSTTGFEEPKVDTNTARQAPAESTAHVSPAPQTYDVAPVPAPAPVAATPKNDPPPPEPLAPPPPANKPATQGNKVYIVRSGDSLHRVAKREGVSVKALARANGLSENASLKLKQKLIIPNKPYVGSDKAEPSANSAPKTKETATPPANDVNSGTVDASGYRTHKVKDGEVLGGIARKYKVSTAKLMELNGITDARKVRAGKVLRIPHANGGASQNTADTANAVPPPPPAENTVPAPEPPALAPAPTDTVLAAPQPQAIPEAESPSTATAVPVQ